MDSIEKQKIHDNYCWTCHQVMPSLFCTTCVRAFHQSFECSKIEHFVAETMMHSWRCPQCHAIEEDERDLRKKQMDVVYINKVLKFVLNLLLTDGYISPLQLIDYEQLDKNAVNAIDLLTIGGHIGNMTYRCFEAFWADIKWIAHNIESRKLFIATKVQCNASKWLLEFTNGEMYSIRLCHECYVNANERPDDWFLTVCKQRHPAVWAKLNRYPWWPAKLMAKNVHNDTADVQFFGKSKRSTIPANNVKPYTEPKVYVGEHKKDWDVAQAGAKRYHHKLLYGSEVFSEPVIAKRCQVSFDLNVARFAEPSASGRVMNCRSTMFDSGLKSAMKITKDDFSLSHRKFGEQMEKKQKLDHSSSRNVSQADGDDIVNSLRTKNQRLSAQMLKLINENSELTSAANATKAENDKLKADVVAVKGDIVNLTNEFKRMVNENGALNSKVIELEKLDEKQSNRILRKMKVSLTTLTTVSQELREVASNGNDMLKGLNRLKSKLDQYDKISLELNELRGHNQWQALRLQNMQENFEIMKRAEISQVKKCSWCQGCGKPDGPYYCCECRIRRHKYSSTYSPM